MLQLGRRISSKIWRFVLRCLRPPRLDLQTTSQLLLGPCFSSGSLLAKPLCQPIHWSTGRATTLARVDPQHGFCANWPKGCLGFQRPKPRPSGRLALPGLSPSLLPLFSSHLIPLLWIIGTNCLGNERPVLRRQFEYCYVLSLGLINISLTRATLSELPCSSSHPPLPPFPPPRPSPSRCPMSTTCPAARPPEERSL